ncbi:MAG: hypothetical protein Pg6B_00610 [Candidatus Azobacteroides pseudotrichonymphae]|jgi:regulatory protein|uniref:Regulatory protein RecX n=1 Tax=Azobacteroides pseudotrichonymphae genomovar. CFP2 TaxID=511995 RepID=B6YR18_AZOPC|nr:regulatory protein RecX [Candidatus Azobacteroides pseudotrichonymphae]MDR0529960.1 RecX family transcriptional regulator [Bacteroidales bacterium OttesenSCG-928-I14]BAG83640.1 regulatory protein RecX [Candidatus Azobacteroides pseudotrichonymphae genomovar. CFP2]GMO32218.1 MAG: hypothetical protein Pg6B_00610 [Candidatus Azobacteroides pseudotrichonymphae]
MEKINTEQAFKRLAKYCCYSERCISDLYRQMSRWAIPIKEQEKIIQKLQKENFLNEKRYCQAFINRKTQRNNFQGIYKIRYELEQKKIPQDLIQQAVSLINIRETRKQLKKLLENKRKTIKGNTNYEVNQKLIRFASQRGFSIEDIELTLKNSSSLLEDNTELINL